MSGFVLAGLALAQAANDGPVLPYRPSHATEIGARLTVQRLLDAVQKKDDAEFARIGRGMAIMLAPDFAFPLDRAKFEQAFEGCSTPKITSARSFPKEPKAEAVRVEMTCSDKTHSAPLAATADLMADDEHVMIIFPGTVERVWPQTKSAPGKP